MGILLQDVHYAVRMLRRSPGFAAAAILSMALGIGANTAIFSLIHTLLLRPLPVQAPEELVEPISWLPQSDAPRANAFAWTHYTHFRDHSRAFASLIAVSPARLQAGGGGDAIETVEAEYLVGSFFPTLGVRPALGRLLEPDDDRAEAPGAAVISWAYWQRRFHGDHAVLGRSLLLNGAPATIVGVAPRAFFGLQVGLSPDVWVPLAMEPRTQKPSRLADGSLVVRIMGRLRPGVSRAEAEAEMRVLDQQRIEDLVKRAPFWRQVQLLIEPAGSGFAGPRDLFTGPLVMVMAVVAVLLLIACANVATLLVARASARQREMAVRVAIGAGRGRLVRQLLTESLLLSGIGGAVGIVLAIAGGNLLVRVLLSGRLPPGFPQNFEIQIQADSVVLLFTAAAVLVTGVLFGLAPAAHAWSTAPIGALREGPGGDTPRRRRFGHALVTAQVALSVALLSAAGLLLGHVTRLKDVDTGVHRERMLLVTLDPERSGYERAQLFLPYRMLIERLEAMPGIQSATVSAVTPIQGPGAARFVDVAGFEEAPEAKKYIPINWVGPRYFETYGTRLIAGREFAFDDIGRARVAIVNQAMARHYFGADNPLGKQFTFTGREGVYEIVGLVDDVKYQQLTDAAPRTIYIHAFQEPRMFTDILSIRTKVAETAVAADVRNVVEDVLKTGAVAKVTTLDRQMDASIAVERTIALLSAFFGVLGALLAALGLYGLLAYTVGRRTREIGIRMALGASRGDVLRMVLGGAVLLAVAGVVAGTPVAFWAQRVAAQALPSFTVDPQLPIAVAAAEMMLVALAAAYLPARRAARVDPAAALKND
jgi:putative ABC transport system permease protein